jgi:hypothetical protein
MTRKIILAASSAWRVEPIFRGLALALICVAVLVNSAFSQTHTETLNLSGGTGFSGTLGGDIDITVMNSSSAQLNITDLDLRVVAENTPSDYSNLLSTTVSNNNTAMTPINIAPTVIGINVPTTGFASSVTGTFDVTAGDHLANGVVGVLDGGVAGSDGKWDDPGQTGILNNATAQNINVGLNSAINASANVTGSINASIPNDITIPNVVDSGLLYADLRLKNSSTVSVNFEPVQNLSIQNLTLSSSTPIALDSEQNGNFIDGFHPVSGAGATLDLSAGGLNLVATTVSGNLVADVMGTINGSIDVAADVYLDLFGGIHITTIDLDNIIDGQLSDGVVSLLDLSQSIALADVQLPFAVTVLHEATTNVDFDDVAAALASGTLGLSVPISLSEQNVMLDLPPTSFEVSDLATPFSYVATDPVYVFGALIVPGTGAWGTVHLDHLAATLGGQFVLDIDANLQISADMLAEAFQADAINVVPEPGSITLGAIAGLGLALCCLRRGSRRGGRKLALNRSTKI